MGGLNHQEEFGFCNYLETTDHPPPPWCRVPLLSSITMCRLVVVFSTKICSRSDVGGKQFLMISQDQIGEIHIVGHENNSMNDIALAPG